MQEQYTGRGAWLKNHARNRSGSAATRELSESKPRRGRMPPMSGPVTFSGPEFEFDDLPPQRK